MEGGGGRATNWGLHVDRNILPAAALWLSFLSHGFPRGFFSGFFLSCDLYFADFCTLSFFYLSYTSLPCLFHFLPLPVSAASRAYCLLLPMPTASSASSASLSASRASCLFCFPCLPSLLLTVPHIFSAASRASCLFCFPCLRCLLLTVPPVSSASRASGLICLPCLMSFLLLPMLHISIVSCVSLFYLPYCLSASLPASSASHAVCLFCFPCLSFCLTCLLSSSRPVPVSSCFLICVSAFRACPFFYLCLSLLLPVSLV